MSEREQSAEIALLRDVQDRLVTAAAHLALLASQEDVGTPERARLRGKQQGVLLAESYVAETIRQQNLPPGTTTAATEERGQ